MRVRWSPAPPRHDGETGAATAELAAALPALVLVLAVALAAVDLGVGHVRCVDAARAAARALARGDDRVAALAEATAAAPPGASVGSSSTGRQVTVVVWAPVPGLLRPLGVGRPRAVAVARLETPP